MIRKDNLESMIQAIGYQKSEKANIYEKKYIQYDCTIIVDFNGSGSIIYPEEKGMRITRKTTCNFSEPENFVVLECITRLMDKGYRPEHIELEKEWPLGHKKKSGFADILVKDEEGKTLFIVECKTIGNEYKKEYNNTLNDRGQLFSYWRQEGNCKWLSLYASDFDGTKVFYTTETIDCSDDANILVSAKKDSTIQLYKNAHTAEELYAVWNETYDKRLCGDVIFREDSQAYQIGVKPLRKADLKDFSENDIQMLGDLFEQLLNKGFKQNEGQFFTPIPITRFIWDSLPVTRIIKKADGIEFPKIIDYACGAGHFLTQGFEAVNAAILSLDPSYAIDYSWTEHNIFGVEKDYRLACVSKISLFMHGAGDGNIVFGDGLENYPDKDILPESFDILVANPPYSVKAFKPHLKLKNNNLKILDKISNDGSEIETLFVERISQLVKHEKNYYEWQEDEYFKMYYDAFVSSAEYGNKSKQKNFRKLSKTEQLAWYNEHFYNYAHTIEKEKLTYFALIYQQTTLIITAPDDNKAHEKFLGYKWSNRKGQEGIQIITPGGMLYSEDDRNTDQKVCGLIRSSFSDKKHLPPELDAYAYYLNLKDMIDFSSLSFGTFMTIIRSKYHRYLWAYLQSDDFRNQITNGKTMSINQITTKMLDKIMVPLPDKVTIDTFTKFVMDIEKKIDSSQTIIVSLKEQQQVVMNKHFS